MVKFTRQNLETILIKFLGNEIVKMTPTPKAIELTCLEMFINNNYTQEEYDMIKKAYFQLNEEQGFLEFE